MPCLPPPSTSSPASSNLITLWLSIGSKPWRKMIWISREKHSREAGVWGRPEEEETRSLWEGRRAGALGRFFGAAPAAQPGTGVYCQSLRTLLPVPGQGRRSQLLMTPTRSGGG